VDADAMTHFVCNNPVVDGRILMAGCSRELEARLNRLGYEVTSLEMSEFKKSGARLRRLVLDL
jgi:N-dimethylarginine dimethylaminohydrolase